MVCSHLVLYEGHNSQIYLFLREVLRRLVKTQKKYEKLVPELVAIISLALLIGEKDYNKRVCLVIYE